MGEETKERTGQMQALEKKKNKKSGKPLDKLATAN